MAEKEKRRATTFVTSRGAIINVAAPSVYIAPGVTPVDVTSPAELREELDIHYAFFYENYVEHGLDAYFRARTVTPNLIFEKGVASDFWKTNNMPAPLEVPSLTLPKHLRVVGVSLRKYLHYPRVLMGTRLPRLSLVGNELSANFWFGVECGDLAGNQALSFRLYKTATIDNELHVYVGKTWMATSVNIDVKKPWNFDTGSSLYEIRVGKNLAVFLIWGLPVCFAVPSMVSSPVKIKENVNPYSIVLISDIPEAMQFRYDLEADRTQSAPSDTVAPISVWGTRVTSGSEIIPMRLPLYVEDTSTLLAGLVMAAGSTTSHPFPIFGYEGKSIHFRSDTAATPATALEIEYYTQAGNWRVYSDEAVRANTLETFNLVGEGVLARIKFTPDSYPAQITDAEVVLR